MSFRRAGWPGLAVAFTNSHLGGGGRGGRGAGWGMWVMCFNYNKYLLNFSAVPRSSGRLLLFPKREPEGRSSRLPV